MSPNGHTSRRGFLIGSAATAAVATTPVATAATQDPAPPAPEPTAFTLREHLGLTGTKMGCDQGARGRAPSW
ncbi:secreted PhoX family phosphatase [Crossiella equi]|uniref:Secreted PhoX family phosphatase n=1 Tax=Crossiella equi TaxID=130796 RepID=A0ABS5A972_9PSEU|nr:hypothetical protein [Crossiella equi]MBP2473138.1 secreted PhoX family phosphatase [Crossiella equi]